MNTSRITLLASCGLVASVLAAAALAGDPQPAGGNAEPKQGKPVQVNNVPPVPATPAAVREIVYARPFTLAKGYTHEWRKDKPQVDAGYVVVIRANSDYLFPRQVAMPLLMVGNQTAEPMNVGYASGTLVAIVPAARKADGSVDLDLTAAPIYFAQPILAESVDQAAADEQLAFARASGVAAMPKAAVQAAAARGGDAVVLADREALDHLIGSLVRTYAGDETARADELEGKPATK